MGKYSKQRTDSWAAPIDIEDQWKIYHKMRRWNWERVASWAAKEYMIDPPSRSALYRWRDYMRSKESTRRIDNAVIAQLQVGEVANAANLKDPLLIDAYKTMAAELAMNGNVADAMKYTSMALALAAQQTKTRELELKAAAQQTKDEALELAREKFEAAEGRLNAAKEVVGDVKLTDAQRMEKMKDIFGL